jgi:hypothetical protein
MHPAPAIRTFKGGKHAHTHILAEVGCGAAQDGGHADDNFGRWRGVAGSGLACSARDER